MKLILALLLLSLNAQAAKESTWWCTAKGITLTYATEVVWGGDHATLVEAEADALANCRQILSQCNVEECWDRSVEERTLN